MTEKEAKLSLFSLEATTHVTLENLSNLAVPVCQMGIVLLALWIGHWD